MPRLSGFFKSIFILLLLAAAPAAAGQEHHSLQPFSVQPLKERGRAADFSLKDMEGRKRTLGEFRGKVLLVHFWASWCEPCKKEFPALSALASEFGPKGLVVLGVAEDSRERVEAFMKENRAGFPILFDQYGSVMRDYRVSLIPVSVIVGKDGFIEGTLLGPREYGSPEAHEYFEKILK
ncbi:glutathione peroxidase [Methylophilaceae bacterium]|nr:glutathione peroxidase [Methylophilaceae bacterium]